VPPDGSQPGTTQTAATIGQDSLKRVRGRLEAIPALADEALRLEHSVDTYWKAAALANVGRHMVADAVVRPRSADDVASTIAAAAAEGVPVVPGGGGSGSQGGAVPDAGGIVLDLQDLDEIVELDEEALTVRVQSGVPGLRLEEGLNERGYTFPHQPPRCIWRMSAATWRPRGPALCRRSTGRSRTSSRPWRCPCRRATWSGRCRFRGTPWARTSTSCSCDRKARSA
jgi:hypothetical protein